MGEIARSKSRIASDLKTRDSNRWRPCDSKLRFETRDWRFVLNIPIQQNCEKGCDLSPRSKIASDWRLAICPSKFPVKVSDAVVCLLRRASCSGLSAPTDVRCVDLTCIIATRPLEAGRLLAPSSHVGTCSAPSRKARTPTLVAPSTSASERELVRGGEQNVCKNPGFQALCCPFASNHPRGTPLWKTKELNTSAARIITKNLFTKIIFRGK